MTRNQTSIASGAAGFLFSLGVFLFALSGQNGLIAAVACLVAWLQLMIVIATAGDAMSNRQASKSRSISAALLVALLALAYAVASRRA
jgi:hypothetical protein